MTLAIDPKEISGNFRARMANVRKELCELINAYGPFGAVVATQSGKVIARSTRWRRHFLSGRGVESKTGENGYDAYTRATGALRRVDFLDEDGFTALYREGRWFYQKYHSREQVEALCKAHKLEIVQFRYDSARRDVWQVVARKVADLPAEQLKAAVDYEFNLPVSDTQTLQRHNDAWSVFKEFAA